jgi:hypothetical protein
MSLTLSSQADEGSAAAHLRLVPFPKEVSVQPGVLLLDQRLTLTLPAGQADVVGELIAAQFKRAGLPVLELRHGDGLRLNMAAGHGRPPAAPELRPEATPEEYSLAIDSTGISAMAGGPAGLQYAAATLVQLLRANRVEGGMPCLRIRDWPSIRWRAYQDDLTRGPSSTLDQLRREVDLGAALKMNLFTYYMEYQYAFRKHPQIGPADGSLKPEELRELVAYGAPRHVDILGNQQSFGHFGHILKHDRYKHLQEVPEVLTPVKEETYQLLDDLYSEVIPLLPFEFFNVCCDETWGLGTGPSKGLAEQIGTGGVYARHLKRVHELITGRYGKRMMMWGDIILQHPDHLAEIPRDTIMLTWAYHPADSFEVQIVPFAKSGYEFFVCPGVNNWRRLLPDFQAATVNIRNFVCDGAKHGCLGVLNTAWDDDGETLNAPNWHGLAWGAECAWNASTTTPEAFNKRIGAVLFGERDDHFGQAVELLGRTHKLPGMNGMENSRFWQLDLGPGAVNPRVRTATAERLLTLVRPAIKHLRTCRDQASVNQDLLDHFLYGARRLELIGERLIGNWEAAQSYRRAYEAGGEKIPHVAKAHETIVKLRDAHADLAGEFERLWRQENRPYALDWTLKKYTAANDAYSGIVDRLSAARAAAEAGRALPPQETIGLHLFEANPRTSRPARVEHYPLITARWHDEAATHRIGITVEAGSVERTELPVEVQVKLPESLVRRPVRAFAQMEGGQGFTEVPAQLDAGTQEHPQRLVTVIEYLPAGGKARVVFYLGRSQPGPTLAERVWTSEAAKGARWIENDQVRLLLAPEGGHVYRWVLKEPAGRDLTMPGETCWFGFSDSGGRQRGERLTLECVAAGPAMVRYVCRDENGLGKTVSLYAGTTWMEVVLDLPTAYYWDFDDAKNFAADGPYPGQYLFSTGAAGPVGREADGLKAQVRCEKAAWAVKYLPGGPALGMVTPGATAAFVVGPGGGYGGVGIEGAPAAAHFVTYAGLLKGDPGERMSALERTLNAQRPPTVTLYALERGAPLSNRDKRD